MHGVDGVEQHGGRAGAGEGGGDFAADIAGFAHAEDNDFLPLAQGGDDQPDRLVERLGQVRAHRFHSGELDIEHFPGSLEVGHAGLIPVGVGAEDFHEAADPLEFLDGVGHFLVVVVAVAVDEKQVLPRLALAGTRLDAGHVEPVLAERPHDLVQCTDLVLDADDEAGAVVFRGGTALAAQHKKPGGVRGVVLNVVVDDLQVVALGGQRPGNGGTGLVLGGFLGGAGGGGGLDDLDRRQVLVASRHGTAPAPAGGSRVGEPSCGGCRGRGSAEWA